MNFSSTPKDMLGRHGVVSLSEALAILHGNLSILSSPPTEEIGILLALHRITGQRICSPEDLPSHCRSIVDGYAVRASDTFGATETLPVYLEIAGDIPMGRFPELAPPPLHCCRIATGGFLPPDTDAVIMLEHTVTVDGRLIEVTRPVPAGGNVIGVGEDVEKGGTVIEAGRRLRSQDIGMLAGLGFGSVHVHREVRVGIFSTGDEIVAFDGEVPDPGKIRDMNGPMLVAMTRERHAHATWYGIVPDQEDSFRFFLQRAIAENDLVVFSGSSSVGTKDLGERLIEECGPPGVLIHGVAIKPGKPVIVAFVGFTPVFGLPGHPVSTANAFDLFVGPAIDHLAGLADFSLPARPAVLAMLTRNLHSAGGRVDFVRVSLGRADNGEWEAHPILGKSGALSTLVKAHGYIVIDESREGLCKGEQVTVHILS